MTETGEARAAADMFSCEGCGSQMLFDPNTQKLKCEHCALEKEIPAPLVEAPEYLYNPQTDSYTAPDWEALGNKTVRCKNCGASTVVSSADMTAVCSFCGSHYVMDEDEITIGILPETIMPFQISRERASGLFRDWVKRRFWAPRAFKKASHRISELHGVYIPFWTYDAHLYTSYVGQGGRDRTETYTTRDEDGNTHTHTRTVTDWYPIAGNAALSFDDEKVCATRRVDTQMLDETGTYSTKMLRRYAPAFLCGFAAQRYDVGVGEGWKEAGAGMEHKMENHVEQQEGYDHYRGMQYQHQFDQVRFKHILLPLWLSSYPYKQKVYSFMVNGETGVVAGKSPVSALKVAAAVLLAVGLIALLLWFIWYFRG